MDSLYNTLVSLLGGGLSGWIIASHQKRLDRRDEEERQKNANQIAELQEKRFKTIENNHNELKRKFEKHVSDDRSQEILAKLEVVSGNLLILSQKIDRALENNAEQNEKLRAHDLYLKNLNDLLVDKLK